MGSELSIHMILISLRAVENVLEIVSIDIYSNIFTLYLQVWLSFSCSALKLQFPIFTLCLSFKLFLTKGGGALILLVILK